MLGKIFTVCVLLSVSACLVRSQPDSQEKIAGIANDVLKLLSKVGAKSTNEAVAKLWAKGREMSEEELEVLRKLLKSSDETAALAALQGPVTIKVEKLGKMQAQYKVAWSAPKRVRQKMVEDMNKILTDIDANMTKYNDISRAVGDYIVPEIKYDSLSIIALGEIKGVNVRLLNKFVIDDTFSNVLEASLLTRNLDNIKIAMRDKYVYNQTIAKDELTPLNKLFKSGNLEKDVYPIYNGLIEERGLQSIASYTYKLEPIKVDKFAEELSSINNKLSLLKEDLQMRAQLFDLLDISAARKAQIKSGSLRYLRGAGKDGEDMLGNMSLAQWAKNIRTRVTKSFEKAKSKFPLDDKVVYNKQLIDRFLEEIEQIP